MAPASREGRGESDCHGPARSGRVLFHEAEAPGPAPGCVDRRSELRSEGEVRNGGWTALSRHSRTRSTPRAGSQFQLPSAPCSSATATPGKLDLLLPLARRSGTRCWRRETCEKDRRASRRPAGLFGRARRALCRALRRRPGLSPSTATAASSFLKAFAATPVFEIRSLLSALATSFRCGHPNLRRAAQTRPAKKSTSTESFSARGAAAVAVTAATREHGNDAPPRGRRGTGHRGVRARHIPVLLSEVLSDAAPAGRRDLH